jgi:hypothetical protein
MLRCARHASLRAMRFRRFEIILLRARHPAATPHKV